MSILKVNYLSQVLGMQTDVSVILPENAYIGVINKNQDQYKPGVKYQTLWLLHGEGGEHEDWARFTSIERYANKYMVAVIMPGIGNGGYTDMKYGYNYFTFLSEELPRFMRFLLPLSSKREDNFVAGVSMGGYGSFKLALRKPEMFCAAASISGTIDMVYLYETSANSPLNICHNYEIWYGSIDELCGSDDDIIALAQKLVKSGIEIPRLYQSVGTEDTVYYQNVQARDKLFKAGIDVNYCESPGRHDWDFWDQEIQNALEWFNLKGKPIFPVG